MRKGLAWLMLAPGILFVVLLMLVPLFSVVLTTFFEGGRFTLGHYWAEMQTPFFRQVFWRSARLGLLSTALCMALGFPTAYYIAKISKNKGVLMALCVFPLFTSPVIRSFSWMVLLGKKGIVNQALVGLGLFASPQKLLYNEVSMTIGFVQLFLPQMMLSLVSVMDAIPHDVEEAAQALGANRLRVFMRVVFPLCVPGFITGAVLVFTGCMTAYTTPMLLGSSDTQVLSTMIYQYAMSLRDWMKASVVAVTMIVVTMLVSKGLNGVGRRLNPLT